MPPIGNKFSFTSKALPEDTFDLVSFNGSEGLSRLYRFDVTLLADSDELDLASVIQSRATLKILREDGDITFHGILSTFEQMETVQERTHYRAVLSPLFWRETLTYHNQIFLDKTVPEIIEAAMKDGGLTSLDYEFRLTGQYLPHEYVCQYNETHHSFISRLMEREGIYYYFEQGESAEKVIITDTGLLHSVMAEGEKMYYSPPSGLDESSREEVIKSLVCCQKMLPARVLLKDYNYRKPSLELTAEYKVSDRGLGDVYLYGEHFPTPEEGQRLARIRAEALICRAQTFQGESLIPYLRPGYIFMLAGHNRKDFNRSYLTTDITHHGEQTFLFTAGLDATPSAREASPYYRNSFTAISSESQFRPERTTEKPRFSGTMHAHIDAAGSGKYAEIDEHGRYKVRLPFDLNSPSGGKASSWIRMAQPYAGDTHGMHFPLHKGTEVLLTFIDGDPDRPIIAAAVPNPLTPSPVTSANATQSKIKSAGGNEMHMEDQEGTKRILLNTPQHNSWIRMGAPNDPPGFTMPKLVYGENSGGGGGTPEKGTLKITIEPEEVHENATCTVTSTKDTTFQAITLKHGESRELATGEYTLTYNHIGAPYAFEPSPKKVTISANKTSAPEATYRKTKVEKDLDDTNTKVEGIETELADEAAEKKKEEARAGGLRLNTEGHLEFAATMENKMIRGEQLEIVLGNVYDVLIGTETSFKVAAALEMFLGMKMDMALATNIEYGFGLWHTHFNEGELSGNHKVEINAGGSSVTLDLLVAAMAALAAVDTALVAGIGFGLHDLPDDDNKKEWFVNTNGVAYAALLAALDAAVFISQKLNPIQYNSRIELGLTGIEQKVTLGSIEQKVVTGNIKHEVDVGNIEQKVVAGKIEQEVTTGKISLDVTTGDIKLDVDIGNLKSQVVDGVASCKVLNGTLTNEVVNGSLTNSVAVGTLINKAPIITTTATTSITSTAPTATMATTGDAAKVQLAANACNITANTGNLSFLSAVQIQAGAIIKLQ